MLVTAIPLQRNHQRLTGCWGRIDSKSCILCFRSLNNLGSMENCSLNLHNSLSPFLQQPNGNIFSSLIIPHGLTLDFIHVLMLQEVPFPQYPHIWIVFIPHSKDELLPSPPSLCFLLPGKDGLCFLCIYTEVIISFLWPFFLSSCDLVCMYTCCLSFWTTGGVFSRTWPHSGHLCGLQSPITVPHT